MNIMPHALYISRCYLSQRFAERQYSTAWASAWKKQIPSYFFLAFNDLTSSAMAEMTIKDSVLFFIFQQKHLLHI